MKRFIGIFASIMAVYCGLAHADWTTGRMGLTKPTTGQADTWGRKLNQNFEIIDSSSALLNSEQSWTSHQNFVSSVTFSTFSVYQVRVATPNFTGSDRVAVDGSLKVGGGVSGGIFYACGTDWTKCSSLSGSGSVIINNPSATNSVNIVHDGSANGSIVLRANAGAYFASPTTSVGSPVSVGRIMSSPNWFSFSSKNYEVENEENAFEYSVLVGTVTNRPNAKMLILSSSTYSYDLVVGSTSVDSSSSYHLTVSTSGITSLGGALRYNSKTKAQIQAISNPRPVAGDSYYCSDCTTDAVCVSTGGVNSFVRFSARTTACN